MMKWLLRFERGLFHLLGPAQVTRPHEEPDRETVEPHDPMPPGFERRGTPGNYYIVKTDEEPPNLR